MFRKLQFVWKTQTGNGIPNPCPQMAFMFCFGGSWVQTFTPTTLPCVLRPSNVLLTCAVPYYSVCWRAQVSNNHLPYFRAVSYKGLLTEFPAPQPPNLPLHSPHLDRDLPSLQPYPYFPTYTPLCRPVILQIHCWDLSFNHHIRCFLMTHALFKKPLDHTEV